MLNFPKKFSQKLSSQWWWVLGLVLTVLVIILPAWELLKDRPISANPYFSVETMEQGFRFTRETVVLRALNELLILGLLLSLIFSFRGARLVRRLEEAGGNIIIGIVYISLAVACLERLISLPFSWYLGFYREKQWGLSVQSWGSWLSEYLLSFALDWLNYLIIFLIIFWLLRRFPHRWWYLAGSILSLLSAFWLMIYPVVINPLFNEQVPLQDPQLTAAIEELAEKAGIDLQGVWEEKASLKTVRANAYVTGLGPTKRVVIWDTLIKDYTFQEVETVVAHELGHAYYGDTFWMWVGSGLASFASCFILALACKSFRNLGKLNITVPYQPRAIPAIMLVFFILAKLFLPLANTYSRMVEYRADRFAVQISGQQEAYISVMKKLSQANPTIIDPPPLVEWFLFDHPAPLKRIQAIERVAADD